MKKFIILNQIKRYFTLVPILFLILFFISSLYATSASNIVNSETTSFSFENSDENSKESSINISYVHPTKLSSRSNTDLARLEVLKTVSRKTIFENGSERTPVETRVTITVHGKGLPGLEYNPQDVVFIMDNSDSMDENDNEYKRVEALKLYLEKMIPPNDRAALIKFSKEAELVNEHHLTNDYSQIISDLPALWHTTGLTNLGAAIKLANRELIEFGDRINNSLVAILLTDGRPEPPENNVTIETVQEAIDNNIKIYTIGLGKNHDVQLLNWLANQTGGKYFYAQEASDLLGIYDELSKQYRNYTAGLDQDITDKEPMVRDVIPRWINYVPGSFSKKPDFIGKFPDGSTKFEWNISKITIGETWSVSYNITSSRAGESVSITNINFARVKYFNQEEKIKAQIIPEVNIRVLPKFDYQYPGLVPPPPPPPPPIPPSPPAGFPLPSTATTSLPIGSTPPVPITAGASPAAIPVEYILGLTGLGIAERIRHIRLIKSRQKVALGV